MANVVFLLNTEKTCANKRIVVGMACISRSRDRKCLQLHTVYVRPMHRKQGIGKALVRKAISIAKKEKSTLSLGVNPLNKVAVHLYELCGFRICDDYAKLKTQHLSC